ncbi:MAG: TolC family protein [Piscirickettsiaceae bacterium]|nr:TolC family protein [Piscirickettsiaceae bacterium]
MLIVITRQGFKQALSLFLGIVLYSSLPVAVFAQQNNWTLESSIERGIDISPEIQGAVATVNAKQGALTQAGAWPNPQIELRVDNKISKDKGSSGADFTQFAYSQPLPISGRIGHQQAVAKSELNAAQAQHAYQRVVIEYQVAQRYHHLQLSSERMLLAEQRLELAKKLQHIGQRRAQAGELSHLEKLRLDLIRESAQQILDKSEGSYNEALAKFRTYLNLSSESQPELQSLKTFNAIASLQSLQQQQSQHALFQVAQYQVDAARYHVDLAKSERLPDPTLRLFYDQDLLNGRQQSALGIGIGITIPLWDNKKGRIKESQARVIKSQTDRQVIIRDLESQLQQSYLHLSHLVQQGEHYRTRVLEPAQQVFDLTRKAYTSGEVEILSLIDANNTYFNSHERYLELLQEAWLEASEVRLIAGQSLVNKQDS